MRFGQWCVTEQGYPQIGEPDSPHALYIAREDRRMSVDSMLLNTIRFSGWLGSFLFLCSAYASPALDTLGALDEDMPLVLSSMGPSSAYFNPAHLVHQPNQVKCGIVFVSQQLSLTFSPRPASADISEEVYRSTPADPRARASRALPTDSVPKRSLDQSALDQRYAWISLSRELIPKTLTIGVVTLLPLHRFELQSPGFADERAQYFDQTLRFERWGDRLEGLSSAVGLGYQAFQWLSIGGGISINTHSTATSDVFLSDASYEGFSIIKPSVEVQSVVSPHGSLKLTTPRLDREQRWDIDLSIAGHAPQEVKVDGGSQVKIWNYPYPEGQSSIPQSFSQSYRVLPLRFRGTLTITRHGQQERSTTDRSPASQEATWQLVAAGGWTQWSQYLDRSSEQVNWIDQWEVSAGVSRSTSKLALGLDARWRPSPVPPQIGRSSYVDPSQLAMSVTAALNIFDRFAMRIVLQGHRLLRRHDQKDLRASDPVIDEFPASIDEISGERIESSVGLQTNNPGYPGYQSKGWVWVAGLMLVIN